MNAILIFVKDWKLAYITSVFCKKNYKLNSAEYRYLLVISKLAKVVERLLFTPMTNFIDKNKPLKKHKI